MIRCLSILAAFMLAAPVAGQELREIVARQQSKLEDAVRRLNEQRRAIHDAQVPISKTLSDLREEARRLEEKLSERRRARDTASLSLEQLQEQVREGNRQYEYITGALLGEFVSAYKSALSPAELATYGETIRQHDLLQERAEASEGEKLAGSLALLNDSFERAEGVMGGKTFPGSAVGLDGALVEGRFVKAGPLLYFAAGSGESAGWVEETKSLQARLRPVDEVEAAQIRQVAASGAGPLPVDASLGDAVALAETRETVSEHLRKGGIWVYPIVAFALIASLVAAFKFFQIFLIRQPEPMVVHDIVRLLREGKKDAAHALATGQPQPAAAMLAVAVDHADESIELVEEVMYESMLGTQPRLERFLNVIAVTAATAPLLGLLGTVTGIIKTFKLMEVFGAGDPKPLISGISEALITTELGLVLAIPALIAHAMLSRRVAGVLARMEKLSIAFVNGLARRGAGAENRMKPVHAD